MTSSHPVDTFRVELVRIQSDLRAARQDLARRKREVARSAPTTARTARDRDAEREYAVGADREVLRLEDAILDLQRDEDLMKAKLDAEVREIDEERWLIRQAQADAINNLATVISHAPMIQFALSLVTATGENGVYQGESDYLKRGA